MVLMSCLKNTVTDIFYLDSILCFTCCTQCRSRFYFLRTVTLSNKVFIPQNGLLGRLRPHDRLVRGAPRALQSSLRAPPTRTRRPGRATGAAQPGAAAVPACCLPFPPPADFLFFLRLPIVPGHPVRAIHASGNAPWPSCPRERVASCRSDSAKWWPPAKRTDGACDDVGGRECARRRC